MKKIFAIIMVVCVLASVLCVAAAPAASASGFSVSVCGLSKDGLAWAIGIHEDFEEAWNEAVYYATHLDEAWDCAVRYESENERPAEEGFIRIVVDFYDDWNADSNGEFGSGIGFKDGAIHVPSGAKIAINLGGHTISSGKMTGKVMSIDAGADVNIYNGTIKGDVHTDAGAKLVNNNVYIAGNTIKKANATARFASIFGEGSLTVIVSLLSLVASVAAICISCTVYKKKAIPAAGNKNAGGEDEE